MKITNETKWSTSDMRRIISRVLMEEFDAARRKKAHVRVIYIPRQKGDKGYCAGYAWYNSTRMVIKMPREKVDRIDFAHTVAHEAAHCRGLKHRQMDRPVYARVGNWRELYAWAETMPLELKVEPEKKVADVQQTRYNRVLKNITNWETKLKRAQNALKKYRGKARYYERALAAKKPKEDNQDAV